MASLRRLGLAGGLDASLDGAIEENFSVRVPEQWLAKVGDSPALARQVIPQAGELVFLPEELGDPIGDGVHSPIPGLTHRYADRVLLKLNHHCAVYCRFCFRREKVGSEPLLTQSQLQVALDYIRERPKIWEVILTGGDPLILPDATLMRALEPLAAIPHVASIRFHTRIPSVLPERITPELVGRLKALRTLHGKQPWVVVHINSADEFGAATDQALGRLLDGGIPLLSQSVLLAGVNDTQESLQKLLRGFVNRGIKPYYLHLPDLARGTHGFRIPLSKAIGLYESLRGQISGTCLPTLILDIPRGLGKIDATSHNLKRCEASDAWHAKSPLTGQWVQLDYPPTSSGPE
jgi:lysine 2,3-aminomutase